MTIFIFFNIANHCKNVPKPSRSISFRFGGNIAMMLLFLKTREGSGGMAPPYWKNSAPLWTFAYVIRKTFPRDLMH